MPDQSRPARSRLYPWYDSVWLEQYVRAKAIVREVRPEALAAFIDAFRMLHTRPDFAPRVIEPFDAHTLAKIRSVVAALEPERLALHEARTFRRYVVHDHPYFTELQRAVTERMSAAVGEAVEPSYNFLSLYADRGVCPLHMDAPNAKWTLDLCIDQEVDWPIHFSRVQPWSELEAANWASGDWEARVKGDERLGFQPVSLRPGEAVAFSGSSQWHYRDVLPAAAGARGATLLFFHFIPAGSAGLAEPRTWAERFGIPALSQVLDSGRDA